MALFVPAVKIPYNIYFLGIRGPHGKTSALFTFMFHGVSPELFIQPKMAPLIEEIEIIVCDWTHIV
jgi:hypothetical protein